MRTIITSLTLLTCLSASAQNIVLNEGFGFEGFTYVENTSVVDKFVLNPDGSIISAGRKYVSGGSDLVLTKHDAIGTQDMTFGANGIALTDMYASVTINSIQLQADGKILVAGSTETGVEIAPGIPILYAFVARYHPNGIIDSSFATNGIFTETDYDQSEFTAVIVQTDQSLILVSYADGISYFTKLTTNGTLDNSYGTNGIRAISDLSTFFFFNRGAISLADGSILTYGLDGTSAERLSCIKTNSAGDLVTSFGQNGIASFDSDPNGFEMATKAQELADGKIVLAGESADNVIIRLEADGTLDSTFATNGILMHTHPSMDMIVQPTGKILIGGQDADAAFNYSLIVTRFNTDGTIDNSFNSTGYFEFDFSDGFEMLNCMVLTNLQRLLIGGRTEYLDQTADFLLAEIDMSESLGLTANKSDEFSMYPNPFSDKVILSVEDPSITSVELTDAMGRSIGNYSLDKQTVLSLEHLNAGIYHVVFTNDQQERISRKLIKN
ncbi:MAG: T9SS type A sorting domain-containing protein [Fluviicola sp.]